MKQKKNMVGSTESEELLPKISCNLAAPQACSGLANPTQLQFFASLSQKQGLSLSEYYKNRFKELSLQISLSHRKLPMT